MNDWPAFHDNPTEQMRLTFLLERHGWASMAFGVGASNVEVGAFGYCTDALGDLVRAALAMVTGALNAQVILDGEPTLWGIAIHDGWQPTQRPQAHRLSIRSRSGNGGASPSQVTSWSDKLFEGYVTADAFATAVSQAAHDVLTKYGEAGYLARWVEYPFPTRALIALDAALAASPPEPRGARPLTG